MGNEDSGKMAWREATTSSAWAMASGDLRVPTVMVEGAILSSRCESV